MPYLRRVVKRVTDTESLLDALDSAKQWIEAAAGYRQKAVDSGFSEEAAELMALEFHELLLAHVRPRG